MALGFNLTHQIGSIHGAFVSHVSDSYHLCQIVEVLENNRVYVWACFHPLSPLFSGNRQVMKFY